VISGFSKVFSVTGWRLGYAITSKEVIAAMSSFNDLIYVCAPAPLQIGVAQGLKELDDSYYKQLVKVHQEKRDLFCETLQKIGLKPSIPKGAYYVMCDISDVEGEDDKAKVLHILKKTGVASVAGRAFYDDESGANMARFCYSKPMEVLKEANNRMLQL
jgi:aminotransferase